MPKSWFDVVFSAPFKPPGHVYTETICAPRNTNSHLSTGASSEEKLFQVRSGESQARGMRNAADVLLCLFCGCCFLFPLGFFLWEAFKSRAQLSIVGGPPSSFIGAVTCPPQLASLARSAASGRCGLVSSRAGLARTLACAAPGICFFPVLSSRCVSLYIYAL